MENRNSIQKGDELEKKAFELLKEVLMNEDFFVSGKKSKIYLKKPYYSEKRKGNIIFDITIETFLSGSDKYSLLTIFECKNLKNKVSVDDIEEFNSKISEIGEHNTKGIVITTSHFQEGAYNYALSQNIGIIRITSNDKFDWINYRKDKSQKELNHIELAKQFTDEAYATEGFISNINFCAVYNFADVLLRCRIIDLYIHKEKFINIPFISDKRIDDIIERLSRKNVYSGLKLDTEKLCNFLSEVYPISFDFETNLQNNFLGKIEFDPIKIGISSELSQDLHRWRFTLAHEIGHLVLHHKILKDKLHEKTDTQFSISFRHFISEKTTQRLELQANIFASHLLLPDRSFKKTVAEYFIKYNINKGFLYLDRQQINRVLAQMLLDELSEKYEVSHEVAKIRLITLGLLHDKTETSLKHIFREFKFG